MPDRPTYAAKCAERWSGVHLADAKRNWADFGEIQGELVAALKDYRRDPQLQDVSGKFHNPDGTLTAMLWNLQANLEPDQSCLHPLLDFEEHFQKVFLRRGLIIYCTLILQELEQSKPESKEPCLNIQ